MAGSLFYEITQTLSGLNYTFKATVEVGCQQHKAHRPVKGANSWALCRECAPC